MKEAFENIVGKGENAVIQHFFSFSNNAFVPFTQKNFNYWVTFILSTATALNLDLSKILSFGKVGIFSETQYMVY